MECDAMATADLINAHDTIKRIMMTYLVAMFVMIAVEVVLQALHELELSTSPFNQSGDIMNDVEGVRPFVA